MGASRRAKSWRATSITTIQRGQRDVDTRKRKLNGTEVFGRLTPTCGKFSSKMMSLDLRGSLRLSRALFMKLVIAGWASKGNSFVSANLQTFDVFQEYTESLQHSMYIAYGFSNDDSWKSSIDNGLCDMILNFDFESPSAGSYFSTNFDNFVVQYFSDLPNATNYNYDGGDCCPDTCAAGANPGSCGSQGYFCMDPSQPQSLVIGRGYISGC